MSDLSFNEKSLIFFCLNNCESGLERNGGTHWSLVLLDTCANRATHYDSAQSMNRLQAKTLLDNMGLDNVQLSEGPVLQQTEGHECGFHVIVNARLLLAELCADIVKPSFISPPVQAHSLSPPHINLSDNVAVVPDNNGSSSVVNVDNWLFVKGKHSSKPVGRKINNKACRIACKNRYEVLNETLINVQQSSSGSWFETPVSVKTKPVMLSKNKKTRTKPMQSCPKKVVLPNVFSDVSSNVNSPISLSDKREVKADAQTGWCSAVISEGFGCEYLLIGDSILRYVEKICEQSNCTVSVNPGAKIKDIKFKLMKHKKFQPKFIQFHAGTNNLPLGYRGGAGYNGGYGKREALHSMADLLYTTRSHFPYSSVLVNSVLPRSDISNTALSQFNDQLELMCGNFGVTFVNVNEFICKYHLARDGRHLNRKGVSVLGSLLSAGVDELLAERVPTLEGRDMVAENVPDVVAAGPPASPEPSYDAGTRRSKNENRWENTSSG